jgi:cytochrome c556
MEGGMRKVMVMVFALAGMAAFTTLAISAEDLAKAVKERRHLMKDVVGKNTKLGGDTLKGKVTYDADKLAKAMTAISEVPDQYVKLFPKGSEKGAVKDSEALPKIWEDFDGFKANADKLKDASTKAAEAATQGKDAFAAAFKNMTNVCKDCHDTYRAKEEE